LLIEHVHAHRKFKACERVIQLITIKAMAATLLNGAIYKIVGMVLWL